MNLIFIKTLFTLILTFNLFQRRYIISKWISIIFRNIFNCSVVISNFLIFFVFNICQLFGGFGILIILFFIRVAIDIVIFGRNWLVLLIFLIIKFIIIGCRLYLTQWLSLLLFKLRNSWYFYRWGLGFNLFFLLSGTILLQRLFRIIIIIDCNQVLF